MWTGACMAHGLTSHSPKKKKKKIWIFRMCTVTFHVVTLKTLPQVILLTDLCGI